MLKCLQETAVCVFVPGGSIDVNLLLTQLLAKGVIGQKDTSQSATHPPATEPSSAVAAEAAAATAVSDVSACALCFVLMHVWLLNHCM